MVGHLEKLRKPLTIGHLACATSVVKEGTLHMNALLVLHHLVYTTSVEEDTLHDNAPLVLQHLAYATSVEKENTLLMNAVPLW